MRQCSVSKRSRNPGSGSTYAVHFRVKIYNRFATRSPIIGTNSARTRPVIRTSRSRSRGYLFQLSILSRRIATTAHSVLTHRIYKSRRSLINFRRNPRQILNLTQNTSDIFDALHNSFFIVLIA
jgi:hypothetical protein